MAAVDDCSILLVSMAPRKTHRTPSKMFETKPKRSGSLSLGQYRTARMRATSRRTAPMSTRSHMIPSTPKCEAGNTGSVLPHQQSVNRRNLLIGRSSHVGRLLCQNGLETPEKAPSRHVSGATAQTHTLPSELLISGINRIADLGLLPPLYAPA